VLLVQLLDRPQALLILFPLWIIYQSWNSEWLDVMNDVEGSCCGAVG
jgi:hypothetical protein